MRSLNNDELVLVQGAALTIADRIQGGAAGIALGMTFGSAVAWKWTSAGGIGIATIAKVVGQIFGLGGGFLYGLLGFAVGYKEVYDVTVDWINLIFQGNGGSGSIIGTA